MAEFVCPNCRAEIHPDLIETTGAAVCPFCNADLSELGLPHFVSGSVSLEPESSEFGESDNLFAHMFPPLPEKSRIKVVEASDDRLVLYLPGGGKQARGLGCFALLWNGFMCLFTPLWFLGVFQGAGNNAPPTLFLIGFLGLFWAVGLGMALFWMQMKYKRTFLLIERHRLVVQQVLFNRKRIQETTLTADSRADLVESYQQNDVPVYHIEVRGQDRPAKFATALADEEKNWIVDRINEFRDVVSTPVVPAAAAEPSTAEAVAVIRESCRQCGAPLTGDVVNGASVCRHCGAVCRIELPVPAKVLAAQGYERLEPADIPPESAIRIKEDSPQALELHYAVVSQLPLRWIVPLIFLPFSLAWYGVIFSFIAGAWQIPFLPVKILFLVFSLPFLIAGLFPLALGLIAFRGRTSVRLTEESLRCSWHVGWLNYPRSIETASLETVGVESVVKTAQNRRVRGSTQVGRVDSQACCVARAGNKRLYLTLFQAELVAHQVASLLRTRLEKMGHLLRDA